MEHEPSGSGQNPERSEQPEQEPQPHDAAVAFREVLNEFAPEADTQDVEESIVLIRGAADLEEALGYAASAFDLLGVDYDQGLARLGEILQVEAILPYGDDAREAEQRGHG